MSVKSFPSDSPRAWLGGVNSHHTPQTTDRVLWVGRALIVAIGLGFVGLMARVIQLQLHPPPPIAKQIDSQFSRAKLAYRRGSVMDRRGRLLATTRLAKRLFVDPQLIEDPNTFSEQVAYRLGYDPAWVERKIGLNAHRRYVVIDQRLDDRRLQQLKELSIAGLAQETYAVRDYPQGALAGHVVGFVGTDGTGLEGLERARDTQLSGQSGRLSYFRDARLRALWTDQAGYEPPSDGHPVRLSLDVTIQAIAEDQLKDTCEEYQAKAGQLIVMDPHNGEILAMANYPPFDPNRFRKSKAKQRRNRCVTDVFEPGSTFKPFLWAAATDAGFARPRTNLRYDHHGLLCDG